MLSYSNFRVADFRLFRLKYMCCTFSNPACNIAARLFRSDHSPHKICNAQDEDEGQYHVCATKDDVKDCVDVELKVVQVCDTEDSKEYIVSTLLL